MIKGIKWIFIFFTIGLTILGCKKKDSPVAPDEPSLLGVWTETFAYSSRDFLIYQSGNNFTVDTVYVTSEISFTADKFTLRFPGHYASTNPYFTDPIKESAGCYTYTNNVLSLFADGDSTAEKYSVKLTQNGIILSLYVQMNEDSTIGIVAMSGSLWGGSWLKKGGEFIRKQKD
ncbi:MAG: hypothetical protein HY965_07060 [Ignavibacteriales bacterium]|nr:hypothetical protein [Ignavibacteriales bacterium]